MHVTSLSRKRTLLSTVLFAYKQDSKSLVPVIEKAKMYASFHRFKNYFNLKLLVFNISITSKTNMHQCNRQFQYFLNRTQLIKVTASQNPPSLVNNNKMKSIHTLPFSSGKERAWVILRAFPPGLIQTMISF